LGKTVINQSFEPRIRVGIWRRRIAYKTSTFNWFRYEKFWLKTRKLRQTTQNTYVYMAGYY